MKKLALMMLLSTAGFCAQANEQISPADAKVGQTFSLKKEVLFNEGVGYVKLFESTEKAYDEYNRQTTVELLCEVSRSEQGTDCPDYPRTVVKPKYRVIRDSEYAYSGISLIATEKKNQCKFTLHLQCTYSGNLSNDFKKIMDKRLAYEASKLVDIKEDTTEPTPWP
ncbi:MAG: hypothetical protein ACXVCY_08745 [Pseudobdellovibrionaceae bacterium]